MRPLRSVLSLLLLASLFTPSTASALPQCVCRWTQYGCRHVFSDPSGDGWGWHGVNCGGDSIWNYGYGGGCPGSMSC